MQTFQDFSVHATSFSQMTIFPERRIHSFGEKFWMAHLLMHRKFSTVREHCPPGKSFTSRQSLFAAVSARQQPRPPILLSSLVPRPSSRQKSALRFRGINRLKSAAWFGLDCIVNLRIHCLIAGTAKAGTGFDQLNVLPSLSHLPPSWRSSNVKAS
jgi:hypothetical protein